MSYLNEKVAAPVYKTDINGPGDLSPWPRDTPLSEKFELTSKTNGGGSVGVVRLRSYFLYDGDQYSCFKKMNSL
jgi:hypothetical protein